MSGAGRSALVTGGATGIGLACAQRLGARHRVAVTTHRRAAPPPLLGVPCDVTDRAGVEEAVRCIERTHGCVELLVTCAGIRRDGLLVAQPEAEFAEVFGVHLDGTVHVVRAVLPGMLRVRHGRIVLVSSALAATGSPGQTAYCAAKSALTGFARALAREVGTRGVTVNVVAAGLVETALTADMTARQRSQLLDRGATRRATTADEVAAAVEFLLGDDAGGITGAVLPVDGGLSMGG